MGTIAGVQTRVIEASTPQGNWGKFMVGVFDVEWEQRSAVDPGSSVMRACGWGPDHITVLDLQTGEGGVFFPHGLASADLNKKRVWVCPLFEPFLEWLYRQDLTDVAALPVHVELDHPLELQGYRRPGQEQEHGG